MNNNENLVGIIATIFKWRKPIIYLVVAATILSIGVSLLLPNYYSSTTSFYAASTDLAKPEMIFGLTGKAMEYYGGDGDIDRLLTIAESNELKDYLVDTFKLLDHYEIDAKDIKSGFKVREVLEDLYKVRKTKYDAIELTVEDKDRVFAAKMVNAAREKINDFATALIKDSQKRLLSTFEKTMDEKQKEINGLDQNLIDSRKKYGILNIESQSGMLGVLISKKESSLVGSKGRLQMYQQLGTANKDTIMILKASIKGLEDELRELTSPSSTTSLNLTKFNDGLSKVEMLQQLHTQSRNRLSYDMDRYNMIRNAYESAVPSIILIENGQIPIVKSRPKRIMIVLASIFAALLVSVIGVLLINNYSDINWKEELHGK
ncbi:MAG: hypothetical protein JNK41_06825 [Saprospiraceae bacterium]|jgi:tyrosine-protein kinase Etk/Wzc|nr:hypothetical protein [Saprospiraceae bacterium]